MTQAQRAQRDFRLLCLQPVEQLQSRNLHEREFFLLRVQTRVPGVPFYNPIPIKKYKVNAPRVTCSSLSLLWSLHQ
jgi:hypothetical protein